MASEPKTPKQPPVHLGKQLLVAAILLIIVGIVIIVVGKLLFGGLLALLGAVFGVGSQVARNSDL